ncbi:N-acetyltransferase family protein, partial [Litorivivens sp.]|uniref:GNAT family N-acetyltransferase n=1 Tax=Litorivivens sp. TaxID=2020868 RepID=UPI003561D8CF
MALFGQNSQTRPVIEAIAVRPATIEDSAIVVRLARGLSMTDGGRASRLTEESYRRDGFGADPAFRALIAEVDGMVAGYALYFSGYDTDRATRGVYLADLYVEAEFRRYGVGRALMKAAAQACRDLGGEWMFWSVLKRNRVARKFYKTLAPELKDVILCAALGDSFNRLAR